MLVAFKNWFRFWAKPYIGIQILEKRKKNINEKFTCESSGCKRLGGLGDWESWKGVLGRACDYGRWKNEGREGGGGEGGGVGGGGLGGGELGCGGGRLGDGGGGGGRLGNRYRSCSGGGEGGEGGGSDGGGNGGYKEGGGKGGGGGEGGGSDGSGGGGRAVVMVAFWAGITATVLVARSLCYSIPVFLLISGLLKNR